MRITLISVFAADYVLALGNALAKEHAVSLLLARQDLAHYFPGLPDLEAGLRARRLLHPDLSLELMEYPTGQYGQKLDWVSHLVQRVRRLEPQVVHCQISGNLWPPLAIPYLRAFPLVTTIHDISHHPGDWPPGLSLWAINWLASHLSHQIIVHGNQQAQLLQHRFHVHAEKIHILPIGAYEILTQVGEGVQTASEPRVLFFGRLRAYKGLEVLIRAAPQIAARIPGMRIVVAGAGECPALDQAAAEHPEWYEIHNRFIEANEVPGLFQRAAVVVLPYLEASQSGVLPLAYRFRRPIVATRVGSLPEVVEDGRTGILVDPQDERGLADAVIRLLSDPGLREAIGQAGGAKLDRELSWDAIAVKTARVYEQAQHGRAGARRSDSRPGGPTWNEKWQ
jgi:glycosyltransferase involved in cell wall biosynthesis